MRSRDVARACRGCLSLCSLRKTSCQGGDAMPGMGLVRVPLLAALALALTAVSATAQQDTAAGYPNRPVRLIVGFAAGGGTDSMARIVAPKLTEVLGQPVVIENRAGAGGRTAIEFVQSQPADGYTLAFGAIGQLAVAAAINPNLPFHPTRTLTP